MLGIFKAKTFGSLIDSDSTDKQLLGTLHEESTDVRNGRIARQLTYKVAEIVRRQKKLLGTIFHGRKTMFPL